MTAPGSRVAGRYLVRSRLGGGAMGAVWLARDELLGRDVAVKQVLIPVGSDPEATAGHREAAMREGRIAARLTHPHAVSVYDMVDDGGTPWLVMEYLPSRSLAQVLAEQGTLPVQQVAQVGAQVADALVATHAAGVVHRDVKPGNILIGEGGRAEGLVKITDFGISRARGDVSLTQTGVVKGTPAYLAPEVARGQEPDEASDVYSLGATLFACLEGTPPFGMTENPLEMLYRVAGGDFNRPRNAGALTRPLMRMLNSDPGKRPSMTQVRDQLAGLAAGRDRDVTDVLTARTPIATTLTDIRPVGSRAVPAPAEQSVVAPVPDPAPPLVPTPDGPPAAAPADAGPSATPARTGGPTIAPPAAPPARPRGRRRGAVLLAALAAFLVGVGVLLFLLGQDSDRTEAAAQTGTATPSSTPPAPRTSSSPTPSETTAPSTSAAPTPTTTAPTTTAPATTAPAETTAAPPPSTPAGPAPGSAAEVQQTLTSYYALLPGDPAAAWERTGPTLRSAISRANYVRFWNRFSSVTLGPVSASDGSLTATAPVTFVENGAREPEQHTFTFVRGDDGRLLVDSDRAQ
ncbi:serine/threonine protein kinase [Modestobacter muralis]|uniref:non-specific serine/threonine protein kinase n=1 Tax=Modestobacter muralis TaxID=1608614 RepID=A0A6P0ESC8_9ACTN|nr:serine/threonine protein kinase [Modestobacter muralis]NEN51430.1 serine/threonine protein kinase [Modestobacter muralis]